MKMLMVSFYLLYKSSSNKRCYFVKMNFKLADVILFQKIYGLITQGTEYFKNIDCNYYLVADMRKALSRDKEKKSIIPLDHPVRPEDVD